MSKGGRVFVEVHSICINMGDSSPSIARTFSQPISYADQEVSAFNLFSCSDFLYLIVQHLVVHDSSLFFDTSMSGPIL